VFSKRSEAEIVEMFPGVIRRTLSWGERTLLVELTMAAGSEVPWHSHLHEQIGYVVSGRFLFDIGDECREVAATDSYIVPSGVQHRVRNLEDTVVVDIFSPRRDEYLPKED
jgi:quercetin dioxygenase-like cupin family protein